MLLIVACVAYICVKMSTWIIWWQNSAKVLKECCHSQFQSWCFHSVYFDSCDGNNHYGSDIDDTDSDDDKDVI